MEKNDAEPTCCGRCIPGVDVCIHDSDYDAEMLDTSVKEGERPAWEIVEDKIDKAEREFWIAKNRDNAGDRIDFKSLRKKAGYTLRKVEELTGISNPYLSQLENGKVLRPSYEVVTKLQKLYSEITAPVNQEDYIEALKQLIGNLLYQPIQHEQWFKDKDPVIKREALEEYIKEQIMLQRLM